MDVLVNCHKLQFCDLRKNPRPRTQLERLIKNMHLKYLYRSCSDDIMPLEIDLRESGWVIHIDKLDEIKSRIERILRFSLEQ